MDNSKSPELIGVLTSAAIAILAAPSRPDLTTGEEPVISVI